MMVHSPVFEQFKLTYIPQENRSLVLQRKILALRRSLVLQRKSLALLVLQRKNLALLVLQRKRLALLALRGTSMLVIETLDELD